MYPYYPPRYDAEAYLSIGLLMSFLYRSRTPGLEAPLGSLVATHRTRVDDQRGRDATWRLWR